MQRSNTPPLTYEDTHETDLVQMEKVPNDRRQKKSKRKFTQMEATLRSQMRFPDAPATNRCQKNWRIGESNPGPLPNN